MPGKSCGCTGKSKQSPHRGTEGTERIVLSTEERLNVLHMQKRKHLWKETKIDTFIIKRCVVGLRKKTIKTEKKNFGINIGQRRSVSCVVKI